jgi:hypothetical protein
MKLTKQEYYKSIENLPLYNWDKYLSTKDLNWFIIGFDGRQTKIVNDDLIQIEIGLQDEYFTAIKDRAFVLKLHKWAKIDALSVKYNIIIALIKRMKVGFIDTEIRYLFVEQLILHGFPMPKINTFAGDLEELNRISEEVGGIKNQIILLQNELKSEGKKETTSLQKQLLIVSMALNLGYRLNPKEITTLEWVEMCKLMIEKSKDN